MDSSKIARWIKVALHGTVSLNKASLNTRGVVTPSASAKLTTADIGRRVESSLFPVCRGHAHFVEEKAFPGRDHVPRPEP